MTTPTGQQAIVKAAENPNTDGELLHELAQHQPPHATISHPNCQDRAYLHYIETGGDLARLCAQRGNLQGEILNQVRADPELAAAVGADLPAKKP